MTKTIHGVVRGNSIELAESLGIAEGQQVEVKVTVVDSPGQSGDGFARCAGALANDPDWDAIMDEIHQSRKLERRA